MNQLIEQKTAVLFVCGHCKTEKAIELIVSSHCPPKWFVIGRSQGLGYACSSSCATAMIGSL